MAIAILILIGAIALGFYEGLRRARLLVVIVSGTAILGVSNLAANWPWFISDPTTWARTYGYGLLQTGIVSVAIHLLPFIIAYLAGARSRGQRS
jgi:hypothetical protein